MDLKITVTAIPANVRSTSSEHEITFLKLTMQPPEQSPSASCDCRILTDFFVPDHHSVPLATGRTQNGNFAVNLADSTTFNAAAELIGKMYSWRGYRSSPGHHPALDITLAAVDHTSNTVIGTLAVGIDGVDGLHADETFPDQLDALRAKGHAIATFSALAVAHPADSKELLGSLFHVATLYAHKIKNRDLLVIEVNPRHVEFYKRALAFECHGEPIHNARVGAPAALMTQSLANVFAQARQFGGRRGMSVNHSFYPYFLEPRAAFTAYSLLKLMVPSQTESPGICTGSGGDYGRL